MKSKPNIRKILIRRLAAAALFVSICLGETKAFAERGSTFGFYPYGFRGRDANGDITFAVETPRYAMMINASRAEIGRLGAAPRATDAEVVARAGDAMASLPENTLKFEVEVDGRVYTPKGGAIKPEDVRLLRMGRWLQHFEIVNLRMVDGERRELEGVETAVEFFCWADRASVAVRLRTRGENGRDGQGGQNGQSGRDAQSGPSSSSSSTSSTPSTSSIPSIQSIPSTPPTIRFRLDLGSSAFTLDSLSENRVWHASTDGLEVAEAITARRDDGSGLTALNPMGDAQRISTHGKVVILTRKPAALAIDGEVAASLALAFDREDIWVEGFAQATEILNPLGAPQVDAVALGPYEGPLPVSYDPVAGWTEIRLGSNPDIRKIERVRLRLTNPYAEPRSFRLNFSKLGGGFGITGMSPVLLDAEGRMTDIPVQISKNWHVNPAWFSGLAVVPVEGGATREFEFRLAYADWGGGPAVSHAQLCLVGWGVNQQWDQMAIGSFGESICYDPDVNLNRSMIDDMRPLMVWAMGAEPRRKWSWTHNVGGGDFLVAFERGSKQRAHLTGVKTWYRSQGPVMTDVIYGGEALGKPDAAAVRATMRTRTWRSDDYVRALYDLEYKFVSDPPHLDRLAFFQLGADNYNENPPGNIHIKTGDKEIETIQPEIRKGEYGRRGVELPGAGSWIALTDSNKPANIKGDDQGAWANRALILRDFKARIGGVERTAPCYSLYGTDAPDRAAPIVEIGGPVETSESGEMRIVQPRAGDYVHLQVEMIIYPQRSEDYYGPNERFRQAMNDLRMSWFTAYREASAGATVVDVEVGQVIDNYPAKVAIRNGLARFRLKGGLGHTPVTIAGVRPGSDWRLRASASRDAEPWFEIGAKDEGSQLDCDPEPGDTRTDSDGTCAVTVTLPSSLAPAVEQTQTESGQRLILVEGLDCFVTLEAAK